MLSTTAGMTIRFCEEDARPMGRNARGVKGINLTPEDHVVGMVVANEDASLLTACRNGYGKRTPFGPGDLEDDLADETDEMQMPSSPDEMSGSPDDAADDGDNDGEEDVPASANSSMRYRRQRRGGKGVRDIKTTARNGPVVGILSVDEADDVLMVTTSGKIQRVRAGDIRIIGRNTQGVRIMTLDEDDRLAGIARIPAVVIEEPDDASDSTAQKSPSE